MCLLRFNYIVAFKTGIFINLCLKFAVFLGILFFNTGFLEIPVVITGIIIYLPKISEFWEIFVLKIEILINFYL